MQFHDQALMTFLKRLALEIFFLFCQYINFYNDTVVAHHVCFSMFFFPRTQMCMSTAVLEPSLHPPRCDALNFHPWHLGHLPKSKCTNYQLLLTLLLSDLGFHLFSVISLKYVPCGVWLRVHWLKIQATVDLVLNSPDYQRWESSWSLIQTLCRRFVWTKQTNNSKPHQEGEIN